MAVLHHIREFNPLVSLIIFSGAIVLCLIIELAAFIRNRRCTAFTVGKIYKIEKDTLPRTYGCTVFYQFRLDGIEYYGRQHLRKWTMQLQQELYQKTLTVYYDPKNPKRNYSRL